MWQAVLVCSSCAEETEVVSNLGDVEQVYSERAELIELAPRGRLPLAA